MLITVLIKGETSREIFFLNLLAIDEGSCVVGAEANCIFFLSPQSLIFMSLLNFYSLFTQG